MSTLHQVREFVSALLVRKGDTAAFDDEESLVSRGRLDSVDVMEIVLFLEDRFDLDFGDRGFNVDDFDSVAHILAMLKDMGRL